MGALALLKVLAPFMRWFIPHEHLREKDRVGFDVSAVVHPLLRRHAKQICLFQDWTGFDKAVHNNLLRMKRWPCAEVMGVADGFRLDAKHANAARAAVRTAAWAEINSDNPFAHNIDKSVLAKAAGALGPAGSDRLAVIARNLGIEVVYAPIESEHQLVHLQKTGRIDVIACNDSDFIVLGGDNLIIDSCLWSGACRFWSRCNIGSPVSVGKKEHGDDIAEKKALCDFQVAVKDAANSTAGEQGTTLAMHLIVMYSILVQTDYTHIDGIGITNALLIVTDAWRHRRKKGSLTLKGVAAAAAVRAKHASAADVLKEMCVGLLCYRHTLVFNPTTKRLEPLWGEPHKVLLDHHNPISRMVIGDGALAGIDMQRWYAGGYNVITKAARADVDAPQYSATAPDGEAAAAASADSAAEDRPSISWTDERVKDFLRSKWLVMPKTAKDRLEVCHALILMHVCSMDSHPSTHSLTHPLSFYPCV
jgi:hypothetical protein